MAITYTNVNSFVDQICRVYSRVMGQTSGTFGVGVSAGTDRAAGSVTDLVTALLATADLSIVSELSTPIETWQNQFKSSTLGVNRDVLTSLEELLRALALTGVDSLDSYLSYYNYGSGGTNLALQSPYLRDIFYAWKASYPTLRNLWFEITSGGTFTDYLGATTTYTNALRKLVVGTGETAGTAVDQTKYAGGVPYLLVSGFAGSAGTVTVTGTQYDPATGTFTATKTWTVSVTGNGSFALASGGGNAASANALIVAVSGISAAGSITASTTIYAEARKPSGRLAIPA